MSAVMSRKLRAFFIPTKALAPEWNAFALNIFHSCRKTKEVKNTDKSSAVSPPLASLHCQVARSKCSNR